MSVNLPNPMIRKDWTVEDYGIRPAGPDDRCFYCDRPRGATHKPNCVIRSRTVVVRMQVDLVVAVPEGWDEQMINFHRNESSWCASNVIEELNELVERTGGCLCRFSEFTYLREADDNDEYNQNLFVKNLPG